MPGVQSQTEVGRKMVNSQSYAVIIQDLNVHDLKCVKQWFLMAFVGCPVALPGCLNSCQCEVQRCVPCHPAGHEGVTNDKNFRLSAILKFPESIEESIEVLQMDVNGTCREQSPTPALLNRL